MLAGVFLTYRHNKAYIPTYSSTVSVRINVNKPAKSSSNSKSSSSKSNSKSNTSNTSNEQTLTTYGASLESSALNQSIAEKYSSLATSKEL